ncbi:hypothetical protein, partial [Limosilactobacillus fermentum]|uniref:hypothetical protein n=1 Tax=Limosilactobacillus fermentum TaxID=1613 RepID=UPI0021A4CE67
DFHKNSLKSHHFLFLKVTTFKAIVRHMVLLTLVISSPGSDCIKWERKQKKGGGRCLHRPPPKMTHQQDLTKSQTNEVIWQEKIPTPFLE